SKMDSNKFKCPICDDKKQLEEEINHLSDIKCLKCGLSPIDAEIFLKALSENSLCASFESDVQEASKNFLPYWDSNSMSEKDVAAQIVTRLFKDGSEADLRPLQVRRDIERTPLKMRQNLKSISHSTETGEFAHYRDQICKLANKLGDFGAENTPGEYPDEWSDKVSDILDLGLSLKK
ncbi:MAG: hypothetical protein MHPSP_002750, partial [Paramarteilia canceri]